MHRPCFKLIVVFSSAKNLCKSKYYLSFELIFIYHLQTDHTEELEELCQAPNHINESGGESGGEYWLSHVQAEDDDDTGVNKEASEINAAVTDLVVI